MRAFRFTKHVSMCIEESMDAEVDQDMMHGTTGDEARIRLIAMHT